MFLTVGKATVKYKEHDNVNQHMKITLAEKFLENILQMYRPSKSSQ